jgi:hypothetical protein
VALHPLVIFGREALVHILLDKLVHKDVELLGVSGVCQQPQFDRLLVSFGKASEEIQLQSVLLLFSNG